MPLNESYRKDEMLRNRFSRSEKATKVDPLIDAVLEKMNDDGVDSSEYPKRLQYLEKLYTLKGKEAREGVKPDTIAVVIGNLVGILIIVAYEKNNVMTSKAITQLLRLPK